MAIFALILGIVAVVMSMPFGCSGGAEIWAKQFPIYTLVGILIGVAAIVLAVLAMKKEPAKKKMAMVGMILGIVGIVLCGITTGACYATGKAATGYMNSSDFQSSLEDLGTSLEEATDQLNDTLDSGELQDALDQLQDATQELQDVTTP